MRELAHFKNIYKKYHDNYIIEDLSFKFFSNSIVNIKGNNGSGKTTLCKILTSLIYPDSGEVFIRNNSSIYMASNNNRSFYHQMSSRQNLSFFSSLMNISKKKLTFYIDKYEDLLGVKHLLDKKFMNLSEGEKKRLMILRSLIYSPNILLLDEPLNFLDDGTQSAIISIIREYKIGEGKVVITTSNSGSSLDKIKDDELVL